jgi:hypothetical protein
MNKTVQNSGSTMYLFSVSTTLGLAITEFYITFILTTANPQYSSYS